MNIETEALPSDPIDPPVLSMTFAPNTSPLSGQEGALLSIIQIRDRLEKETQHNVAIKVQYFNDRAEVSGRGELQLGVLIENMRREGFELSISPPQVVYIEENSKKMEPRGNPPFLLPLPPFPSSLFPFLPSSSSSSSFSFLSSSYSFPFSLKFYFIY